MFSIPENLWKYNDEPKGYLLGNVSLLPFYDVCITEKKISAFLRLGLFQVCQSFGICTRGQASSLTVAKCADLNTFRKLA